MTENEEAKTPADEAKPEAAQTSDTKAEASGTAKASYELADEDLEAVAGGHAKERPKKVRSGT